MERPKLTKDIDIIAFENFYWLKEELQEFCKANYISASGSKIEIAYRIKYFLRTGEQLPPTPKQVSRTKSVASNLSINSIITKDYRNSEAHRAFFKEVIGEHFRFTVNFMNYFKNNIGKSYADAINEWKREHDLKKQGKFTTEIGKQFEYNQYFRDFFADPQNKDKTRKDAIKCWNIKKTLPEKRKYSPADLGFLKK